MKKFSFPQFREKLIFYKLPLILVLVLFLAVFCLWQNNYITVSRYTVASENLPENFDGFKILQVSDLHNTYFGNSHSYIYGLMEHENPDIIFVTGDIIDRRDTDFTCACIFLMACSDIAPTYCVSGNQESDTISPGDIMTIYEASGATVLDDKSTTIKKGGDSIRISGIADKHYLFETDEEKEEILQENSSANRTLRRVTKEGEFNILLAHRPEYYEMYEKAGADLVFCGHAHGGQIRLPFIGGLYAPVQRFFPKYTEGVHKLGEKTQMVISRGLGNSRFPVRIFNHPEISVITLKCK